MKNKRFARIVAIVLAVLIVLSVVIVAINSLSATAYVTQEEIDRLREEKREYERRKQEIQSQINTIEFERMTEVAKKSVLDDRIILTGLEIDNIKATIELYNSLILEKEVELEIAIAREEEQFKKYRERVRDMEENGIVSYLEIVFDAASFSDLLARLDFVGDIMSADENAYNDLQAAREATKAAKDDLELTREEMEQERLLREEKNEELLEQLAEASALIDQIDDTIESFLTLYAEESAEADRIQGEINKKVEELREQEAREAAARVRGTGQLLWPVPSDWIVTSPYGARLHPVYRVYRQHWGIDIPAEYGANVVASDTGTVIISEYNSSYGNYIVLNHGNGWTTLYAHLSSRAVGVGAIVSKGQVIGYIGSTGVSTGPHLHFEVSIDGNKVDPERYL